MTIQDKPSSEITREAPEVLSKAIGIADTIEREQLVKDLALDEIIDEIQNMRNQSKS